MFIQHWMFIQHKFVIIELKKYEFYIALKDNLGDSLIGVQCLIAIIMS